MLRTATGYPADFAHILIGFVCSLCEFGHQLSMVAAGHSANFTHLVIGFVCSIRVDLLQSRNPAGLAANFTHFAIGFVCFILQGAHPAIESIPARVRISTEPCIHQRIVVAWAIQNADNGAIVCGVRAG
jgi:hypothetical protein